MNVEEFLNRLEGGKRIGQGWTAKCPAHGDRTPSLSVREGDRGILVKCWAGCSLEAICQAVGIHVRDLFYDTQCPPRQIRRRQIEREYKKAKADVKQIAEGLHIDAVREADKFLQVIKGADISEFPDQRLDRLMDSVCVALGLLIDEERGKTYVHR